MKENPEVDGWFAITKPHAEPMLQRIREIILEADPRLSEYIKYGTVIFGYEGDMASFVQYRKRDVSLMFNRGARIAGKFPQLEGSGPTARHMRFADLATVEARGKELAAISVAWCDSVAP